MRKHPAVTSVALALAGFVAFAGLPSPPLAAQQEGSEAELTTQGVKKFRKRQKRPVKMGTSGGNVLDFEIDGGSIVCVSGTLGALMELVQDDPAAEPRYLVLSNNHVIARTNRGRKNEPISQAGLIDMNCDVGEEDYVAFLTGKKRVKFNGDNTVDMALAEAIEGAVKTNGAQLRIGQPGNSFVEPFLGQRVKKAGRSSGFTRGEVVDLAADFLVGFAASSGAVRDAFYRDQIVVQGVNGAFSLPGDSGAVIYEDVKKCPRAIALLFAGSEVLTAGNPMREVMKKAKKIAPRGEKRLVGCQAPAPEPVLAQAGGLASTAAPPRLITREDREFRAARRIRDRAREWVLEVPGVVGLGLGLDSVERRRLVLRVYVERLGEEVLSQVPAEIEGVPTELVDSGRFLAY